MKNKPDSSLAVGAKVFLQNKQGAFLMLKRSKPYEGEDFCRWDIPGGRIIPGETQIEALQREVLEETGLTLNKTTAVLGVQDILRVPGTHTVRITYLGICLDTKDLVLNPKEHSAYKWLTLEELRNMQFDPFLEPIIAILKQRTK